MANIVTQITEKLRPVGVATSYGDPVEVGDSTLIPIALGWFGFGAGGESDDASAGGAAGLSIPLGAYVRRPGRELTFEPNLIALLAVGIPFVWTTGTVLRRLAKVLLH